MNQFQNKLVVTLIAACVAVGAAAFCLLSLTFLHQRIDNLQGQVQVLLDRPVNAAPTDRVVTGLATIEARIKALHNEVRAQDLIRELLPAPVLRFEQTSQRKAAEAILEDMKEHSLRRRPSVPPTLGGGPMK